MPACKKKRSVRSIEFWKDVTHGDLQAGPSGSGNATFASCDFRNTIYLLTAISSARDLIGFFFFHVGEVRELIGRGTVSASPALATPGIELFDGSAMGPLCLLAPVLARACTFSDHNDMPCPVAFNQIREVAFHYIDSHVLCGRKCEGVFQFDVDGSGSG